MTVIALYCLLLTCEEKTTGMADKDMTVVNK
jgi:hypothetical protein